MLKRIGPRGYVFLANENLLRHFLSTAGVRVQMR